MVFFETVDALARFAIGDILARGVGTRDCKCINKSANFVEFAGKR